MNIAILGAGAIGVWVASQLEKQLDADSRVTLIGRNKFVEAARAKGVRAQLLDQPPTTLRAQVAASLDAAFAPYDVVILCMKAYAVDDAIQQIKDSPHVTTPNTIFVAFQNGIGSEEKLAREFGAEHVIAATTTVPVSMIDAAAIRIDKAKGGAMFAAIQTNGAAAQVCAQLATLFFAPPCADYRALKWSKMLLNIMGNASSAILQMKPGDIYANRDGFAVEYAMLREALAVMRALNIKPINLRGGPAALMASLISFMPRALVKSILTRQIARGRGDKMPSFYYDVAYDTRRSEVSYLNGAIAGAGKSCNVDAPINRTLTEVLNVIVSDPQKAAEWKQQTSKLASSCKLTTNN